MSIDDEDAPLAATRAKLAEVEEILAAVDRGEVTFAEVELRRLREWRTTVRDVLSQMERLDAGAGELLRDTGQQPLPGGGWARETVRRISPQRGAAADKAVGA